MSENAELGTNQDAGATPDAGVQGTNLQPADEQGSGVSGPHEDQDHDGQSDGDVENDGTLAEAEVEEVELDGKKYAIPKALKPALMFQADYTQKTQELAEMRRQRESEFEQRQQELVFHAQAQQVLRQQYDAVAALNAEVSRYQGVNWQQASATDPAAAQAAWMQYQQLEKQRDSAVQQLQAAEQHIVGQVKQTIADKRDRATKAAAEVIAKWSPDVRKDVDSIANEAYGIGREKFDVFAANPELFKVLHDAVMYQRIVRAGKSPAQRPQAGKVAAAQPAQAITPAATLPSGGTRTVRSLNDARVPVDEWMKRRNQEVQGQRRR